MKHLTIINMNLDAQIESILFFKGEVMSIKQLSKLLENDENEITQALMTLREKLQDRGITLITKDDKVMLGTSPKMYVIIERLKKEELSKDLGMASLETLSIVLYKGPVRKSEIDYIRGVNSATILRTLLVRGLIERKNDEESQRSFLYSPTFDLLSFLGISSLDELPEYEKVRKELEKQEESKEEIEVGEEQAGNDENQ